MPCTSRHPDPTSAGFSFLLATSVILDAGVLKMPDVTGPLGAGIGGQVLAGPQPGLRNRAFLAVRFLVRYFHTRTLTPFRGVSWTVAGLASLAYPTLR